MNNFFIVNVQSIVDKSLNVLPFKISLPSIHPKEKNKSSNIILKFTFPCCIMSNQRRYIKGSLRLAADMALKPGGSAEGEDEGALF